MADARRLLPLFLPALLAAAATARSISSRSPTARASSASFVCPLALLYFRSGRLLFSDGPQSIVFPGVHSTKRCRCFGFAERCRDRVDDSVGEIDTNNENKRCLRF